MTCSEYGATRTGGGPGRHTRPSMSWSRPLTRSSCRRRSPATAVSIFYASMNSATWNSTVVALSCCSRCSPNARSLPAVSRRAVVEAQSLWQRSERTGLPFRWDFHLLPGAGPDERALVSPDRPRIRENTASSRVGTSRVREASRSGASSPRSSMVRPRMPPDGNTYGARTRPWAAVADTNATAGGVED